MTASHWFCIEQQCSIPKPSHETKEDKSSSKAKVQSKWKHKRNSHLPKPDQLRRNWVSHHLNLNYTSGQFCYMIRPKNHWPWISFMSFNFPHLIPSKDYTMPGTPLHYCQVPCTKLWGSTSQVISGGDHPKTELSSPPGTKLPHIVPICSLLSPKVPNY